MIKKKIVRLFYNALLYSVFAIVCLPYCAFTQTFNPISDSYIHDANPTVNYGTSVDLLVKKGTSTNFRKAFIKFDLSSISNNIISSAVVRLYATSSVAISMNLYQVSDAWTETGITWGNAPAEGAMVATTSILAAPGYYNWDITSYIQSQLAVNDKIISIVVFSASVSSSTINFSSNNALANRPELVISYNQTAPLAPANLSATTVSSSEVGLTWQDNSDDETGFKIERKTANSAFSEIATSGPNTNSYTNIGLTPSTTYIYRVFAYNASGNSSYSNQDSATTANIEPVEYYIDAINGNDGNNGLTPSTAWKTLAKVNATTFGPSNKILFKAGGVWVGRLYPKGSGISGNPIVIDMYGTGNKPLIDGNGLTGTGVVYLYNQQYWEINNLEITDNASSGGDRRGVRIEAENYGTANHIYLKNLNIHNIKGSVGQNRSDKRTGGIGFGIVDVSTQETHFNDILVENCVITSCENQGIITECVTDDGFDPYSAEWNSMKITNAVIRNNTISVISKNAMIIRLFEGGVIENNVCFNTANGISGNTIFSAACSGTVFQYNEGYDNNSPDADGSMYDADLRSPNTYWQYSYSHDNAHGLFWTCTVQADANVVCRYNISQNDQGIIFCINYPVTSVRIYNNTVYIPSTLSPIIISERNNGGSGSRIYTFYNNLIYNQSSTASYDWTSGYSRTIDYNCFYGVHPSTEPADPHKVTTDPKLVNAGSGGIGINSVGGYKLQSGSSCINKGKAISDNGGRDYWGNPLYNGLADIGVNEYTLPPVAPTNLSATVILPAQISLAWTDNSANETGFRVERKADGGVFVEIAVVGPNITNFINTGISASVQYTYRVAAYNASGNSAYTNEASANILQNKTLIVNLLLEGLYRGPGTMRKAQGSSGNQFSGAVADQISIELHEGTNYSNLVYSVNNIDLDTNGIATITIPSIYNGNYYVVIKHRNSIAVVSNTSKSFTESTITHNFDSPAKVYGGNLRLMPNGGYAIFCGDINQDGSINIGDINSITNDTLVFATGYMPSDANGDSKVDALDLILVDNNATLFVSVAHP